MPTYKTYYLDSVKRDNKWRKIVFASDEEAIAYGRQYAWCDVIYRGVTPAEKEFVTLWERK